MTGDTARMLRLVRLLVEVTRRLEHEADRLEGASTVWTPPDRPALRVVNGKGGDTP